jgi:hypothetical protein
MSSNRPFRRKHPFGRSVLTGLDVVYSVAASDPILAYIKSHPLSHVHVPTKYTNVNISMSTIIRSPLGSIPDSLMSRMINAHQDVFGYSLGENSSTIVSGVEERSAPDITNNSYKMTLRAYLTTMNSKDNSGESHSRKFKEPIGKFSYEVFRHLVPTMEYLTDNLGDVMPQVKVFEDYTAVTSWIEISKVGDGIIFVESGPQQ